MAQRKSDDIAWTPHNPFYKGTGSSLDRIASRFVDALSAADIGIHFPSRQLAKSDSRPCNHGVLLAVVEKAHSGDDLVGSSGQAVQERLSVGETFPRLVKDLAVDDDRSVSGKNGPRRKPYRGDLGFGFGQTAYISAR